MEGLPIFKDGVLIDVNVSFKDLNTSDEGLRKFRAIESKARYAVENASFNFPISRSRYVPKKKFLEVINKLQACQIECHAIDGTPQDILTWDVYEVIPPRVGATVDTETYQEQIHKEVKVFLAKSVVSLREETVEICKKILSYLEEGKKVKNRTLTFVRDFTDRFNNMNFVGDDALHKQMASLREDFLDTLSEDRIKYRQDSVRELLKRRMEGLLETASKTEDVSEIIEKYDQ